MESIISFESSIPYKYEYTGRVVSVEEICQISEDELKNAESIRLKNPKEAEPGEGNQIEFETIGEKPTKSEEEKPSETVTIPTEEDVVEEVTIEEITLDKTLSELELKKCNEITELPKQVATETTIVTHEREVIVVEKIDVTEEIKQILPLVKSVADIELRRKSIIERLMNGLHFGTSEQNNLMKVVKQESESEEFDEQLEDITTDVIIRKKIKKLEKKGENTKRFEAKEHTTEDKDFIYRNEWQENGDIGVQLILYTENV